MACPAGGLHAWDRGFELVQEGPRQRVRWFSVCHKCSPRACAEQRLAPEQRLAIEAAGAAAATRRASVIFDQHHVHVESGWTGSYESLPRGDHVPWTAWANTYP